MPGATPPMIKEKNAEPHQVNQLGSIDDYTVVNYSPPFRIRVLAT